MAFTPNYSILMDLPMFWDPKLLDKDIHKVSFYPEMQSRFGILDRMASGDTIRWFDAEPCYIYHIINSWEEENEVILDVVGCLVRYLHKKLDKNYQGLTEQC
ncbi:MAG: hypothetical protein Ct9H300mP20_18860 [Gammaproteobacteria bacterium]|nr:MAG: hypothetical protein Ct9H300mP20_18860 [Gammaproteobacteria bacterium]